MNKHRVAAMAKMSIYEKGYGKKDIQTYEHFKWDYISKNIVIGNLWMTFLYAVAAAVLTIFNIDYLLVSIVNEQLIDFMSMLAFGLLCVWVVFGFVFYFVYSSHYKKAQKTGARYYREMKKLNHIYAKEAENEGNL